MHKIGLPPFQQRATGGGGGVNSQQGFLQWCTPFLTWPPGFPEPLPHTLSTHPLMRLSTGEPAPNPCPPNIRCPSLCQSSHRQQYPGLVEWSATGLLSDVCWTAEPARAGKAPRSVQPPSRSSQRWELPRGLCALPVLREYSSCCVKCARVHASPAQLPRTILKDDSVQIVRIRKTVASYLRFCIMP